MKIALVAFHFKPDDAIGAVRPENWANWLSESHDVSVITREAVDNKFEATEPYKIVRPNSLLVRTLDSLNAFRKKRRLSKAVSREVPNQPVESSSNPTSGVFVYRMPCLYDLWFFACYRALRQLKPDLIIASHSPYVSLIAAYIYCIFNPRTMLWLDFRDLWTKSHLVAGLPFIRGVEQWLERLALARAQIVSTVSEGLRNEFTIRPEGTKPVVIYNSPIKGFDQIETKTNNLYRGLRLCYTGTIYSGWRDPSPLFRLFAQLRQDINLKPDIVRVSVASKNPGNLFDIAAKYDAGVFIDFVGGVSRHDAIRLQLESDVLLLLESPAPEAKGVLTGKVFEYLQTDKPILLIGPDKDSELYQLLDSHGRLISLEEVEAILRGEAKIGNYYPVDYSEISRIQLLSAIESLACYEN